MDDHKRLDDYDRSVAMYDEPHAPDKIDREAAAGVIGRGKFLIHAHQDSYRLQMQTIKDLRVRRVLEIGPGEAFVANYMRSIGLGYFTMDITPASKPTLVGKLEDLDPLDLFKKFELVCAFQMLEHSPYEKFTSNLHKMSEMSSKYVFISLPYSCFGFCVSLSFGFGQSWHWKKDLSFYLPLGLPNRKYREQFVRDYPWAVHYWEIGRKGFPWRRIKKDIESTGLKIVRTFHSGNPYHFFILAENAP